MSIWALPTAPLMSSSTEPQNKPIRGEKNKHLDRKNCGQNTTDPRPHEIKIRVLGHLVNVMSALTISSVIPHSPSSGSSFVSASLSMFWHHPSILSTSVCRSRRKNSPSRKQGEARPESGRLRGPSLQPPTPRSGARGRGEWERGRALSSGGPGSVV